MTTAPWNRSPKAAALCGGLCLLPFAAANAIVVNRIEPWFSMLRPGPHTSSQEYVVLASAIAAIAVGAFIGIATDTPDHGFHVIASRRFRAAMTSRFRRRTISATRSLPRAAASSTITFSFHNGDS